MDKEKVIEKICEGGLVAVIRAENAEKARRLTDACIEGGVSAVEITFTVPMAHHVIESLAAAYRPEDILLGAGTVLDSETARIALLSGANFIVSPHFCPSVTKLCNRYRTLSVSGAMTISEAVAGMEAGADIIKVFPGEITGPTFLKALHGPLPQAKLMPTGGVNIDNVDTWIRAGAAAVGVGGALTGAAKSGDYAAVADLGRRFCEKIRKARTL